MYFTNKITIKLISLLAILLGLSNCEEREPNYYYIPEAVKEYGDFKEGSYWIYAIDSEENEDSIWVENYTVGQNEEVSDKVVLSVFEKITIDCKSNRNIDNYIEINIEKKFNHLGFSETNNNYNIGYGMSFYYKNSFMAYPNSGDSIIVYDSFNVLGTDYKNVLYRKAINPIMNMTDYSKEYDTLEYWIAKDIGIIKKITRNKYENHTYYLKRYNVIR